MTHWHNHGSEPSHHSCNPTTPQFFNIFQPFSWAQHISFWRTYSKNFSSIGHKEKKCRHHSVENSPLTDACFLFIPNVAYEIVNCKAYDWSCLLCSTSSSVKMSDKQNTEETKGIWQSEREQQGHKQWNTNFPNVFDLNETFEVKVLLKTAPNKSGKISTPSW